MKPGFIPQMVKLLRVVSVILILAVSIVQKEDDMKKNLEEATTYDDKYEEEIMKFFFTGASPSGPGLTGYLKAAYRRTNKFACYVKEAVKENLECSMQCLKYMYKCEDFSLD